MPVAAAVVTAAAVTYGVVKSTKAQKEAEKLAERQQTFYEQQAGEYYDLTQQQMELQSQQSQITTLANLIAATKEPKGQRILTLPAAKTYTPVEQINMAIDQWLKG